MISAGARDGLIGLQAAQVAILWLHDWLPVPPLNDVAAVRRENRLGALLVTTIVQSAPFTLGLVFTVLNPATRFPGWVVVWLWVSYGVLFVGELRAWWLPYLVRPEPERAERYARMFGRTHSVLPERNGVRPNTLHGVLHACTLATLVLLALA